MVTTYLLGAAAGVIGAWLWVVPRIAAPRTPAHHLLIGTVLAATAIGTATLALAWSWIIATLITRM